MRSISLLLILLLLAACSPSAPAPEATAPSAPAPLPDATTQPATPAAEATPTTGETITISFAGYDSEREHFEPLIERFNQENPGIQVSFVSLDEITRLADNEP